MIMRYLLLASVLLAAACGKQDDHDHDHDKPAMSEVEKAMSALSEADRKLATAQKTCPVSEKPLGSMGTPIKVDVEGRAVFLCCEGCRKKLLADPAKYLAKLK